MIMENRSKRLSEPVLWGRREKLAVTTLLVCVLVAAVGLGVYALSSGAPARKGCIAVTFASTLGGAYVHECGERARAMCAAPGDSKEIVEPLREACRRAGYPFD